MNRAPHSVEAERAVLGSIIIKNKDLELVFEKLTSASFLIKQHVVIFESMNRVRSSGAEINLITLRDDLEKFGILEIAGGAVYISSLVDGLPKEINISSYIEVVYKHQVMRDLIKISENTIKDCLESGEAEEVISDLESKIIEISDRIVKSEYRHIGEVTEAVLKKTEEMSKHGESSGVLTGFVDIDHLTGGFQPGDLVVIAARPSVGKTTFCLNVAANAALSGKTVGIFSLEDSLDNIVRRMLCTVAKVDSEKVSRGRNIYKEDWIKLFEAEISLRGSPIYIDDHPCTIFQIMPKARRLKMKHGLDLLIIDYLQLIQNSSEVRFENRALEVANYTRSLKMLAKELKIPVICVSQLNRSPEQRPDHRPRLADLKESGAIEQDADLVAFLYREDMYKNNETPGNAFRTEFIVSKHRNGPIGVINLEFFPNQTRFASAINKPNEQEKLDM